MKIIDLLNKIANGEEVPKKIKIDNRFCYEYDENIDYKSKDGNYLFDNYIQINKEDMNREVESLEENKIPKKLYKYKENDNECCFEDILKVYDGGEYEITEDISFIVDKINEIIDYLKSKGE